MRTSTILLLALSDRSPKRLRVSTSRGIDALLEGDVHLVRVPEFTSHGPSERPHFFLTVYPDSSDLSQMRLIEWAAAYGLTPTTMD